MKVINDSPGEGNGNQLNYSYLENSMDRGACRLQSMGSQKIGHNQAHTHTIKDQGRQVVSGYGIKHHKPSHEWWNEYSMLRGQFEKLDCRVATRKDAK